MYQSRINKFPTKCLNNSPINCLGAQVEKPNWSTFINPPVIPTSIPEIIDETRDIGYNQIYQGINIYNTVPNHYNFSFKGTFFPGLYYKTAMEKESERSGYPTTNITPKLYPYTNRAVTPDYTRYTTPKYYESLLDAQNLREPYNTFYKTECNKANYF